VPSDDYGDPEPSDELDAPPRRTTRRSVVDPEPLPSYVVKAVVFLLVAAVVGYLLVHLVQLGRQSQPASTAVPALAPQAQQPLSSEQAAPPSSARSDDGSPKMTSRVIEPSYTVVSGDTLGRIATRFGTTVDALQSINNLPDRNSLYVGQKLVIPNQE
jgi:LysM repeat protein